VKYTVGSGSTTVDLSRRFVAASLRRATALSRNNSAVR
jgi:hypothetical protein